ncbi:hypothetical protein M970_100930 [Encephalitozoon cuniculi EcunIII-L]|nr:hypothetical protein M970_100930 [Encephalitozoon cuniculi EcunIII-L]UYI26561.1 hypothetical protein J0A71_02g03900 [Encephalitozoon cuniculi]
MGPKTKTLLLVNAMVLILLFHFLPAVMREWMLEQKIRKMKRSFNLMLLGGGESLEKLRMLKTLINNAGHYAGRDIPLDGSLEEVRKAYDSLKICSRAVFLRLSTVYNISIFFPVFGPVVIQSVKILRHGGIFQPKRTKPKL